MRDSVKRNYNQWALENIKPEQFICFKYKHPVLEDHDAMFTYEKCQMNMQRCIVWGITCL